jgi:hypothetical protein
MRGTFFLTSAWSPEFLSDIDRASSVQSPAQLTQSPLENNYVEQF